MTNLERLLVSVDASPNGQFASRLAGLIAGLRGMPATVVRISPAAHETAAKPAKGSAGTDEQTIKEAAETAKAAEPEDQAPRPIDVKTRATDGTPEAVVADEARKGYDMMVVGIGDMLADGSFNAEVSRLAGEFEGPLAIAITRGVHAHEPLRSPISLLVPITGTEASRRAAEVALAVARASRARITALYVAASPLDAPGNDGYRGTPTRVHEEAILKDVTEMADRYQVPLQTAVRMELAPDQAILREADLRGHNLVVMGVSRRPGDRLFFGNVAQAIATRSRQSILFVASGGIGTAPEGRVRKRAQEAGKPKPPQPTSDAAQTKKA